MYNRRKSGVLLHISSLPNDYGIGSLGKEAFEFIDFLSNSGMSYWQVLPLNAVFSDPSPYFSISSTANNLFLISLEELVEEKLLDKEQLLKIQDSDTKINYEKVLPYKKSLLFKAFRRFEKTTQTNLYKEFLNYCFDYADSLDDFAMFSALKEYYIYIRANEKRHKNFDKYNEFKEKYKNIFSEDKLSQYYYGGSFFTWEKDLKYRNPDTLKKYKLLLKERIDFYKFTQFIFWIQWKKIKEYASKKRIKIIGDVPFFVNHDSVDVWVNPSLFFLDENLIPTKVAGVPPDYFSRTGQLWGNPLYNWEEHKKQNYRWWKNRFNELYKLVDVVRIDHFRAFDSYWAIPIEEKTAVVGAWEKGPQDNFFHELFCQKKLPIIAEDLGIINDSVRGLRDRFDFPGMFISHFHMLEFDNVNALSYIKPNSVMYTGTHDNQTTKSWINDLNEESKNKLASFAEKKVDELNVYDVIQLCANSSSETFIIAMQDILELDDSARMNIPGTVEGNWCFRYKKEDLQNNSIIERLRKINEDSNRI